MSVGKQADRFRLFVALRRVGVQSQKRNSGANRINDSFGAPEDSVRLISITTDGRWQALRGTGYWGIWPDLIVVLHHAA